jgi:hypothetical protein
MKYYLTEITTYNNGTADATGIYPYDDKDLAVANFHSKMGGAMKNANYASELLVVMSGSGELVKRDYWVRPVPTPEPEPTPEVVEQTEGE